MTARNERGFTLIESLFVLSIFLLVISLSVLLLKPHQNQMEREQFFSQLKADLLYAQQFAITKQKLVNVNFVVPGNFYYMSKQNGEVLVKREFSDDITVIPGSQKFHFRILSNGNVSSFGSLYFYFEDGRYQLTFQLGRGRFYVVKS